MEKFIILPLFIVIEAGKISDFGGYMLDPFGLRIDIFCQNPQFKIAALLVGYGLGYIWLALNPVKNIPILKLGIYSVLFAYVLLSLPGTGRE